MKKKEKIQSRIDEIMDEFDFERVFKAIQNIDVFNQYEDISELKKTARYVLKSSAEFYLSNKKKCKVATGGFEAITYKDGEMELKFVLSEWNTF